MSFEHPTRLVFRKPETAHVFPLPVMMDDGHFVIVEIPPMTERSFCFFKKTLEYYRDAIINRPVVVCKSVKAQSLMCETNGCPNLKDEEHDVYCYECVEKANSTGKAPQ